VFFTRTLRRKQSLDKNAKENRKSHGRGVPEKLPVCRCAPLCEKVSWEDPQIFPAYRSKSNSAKDAQSASGEHFIASQEISATFKQHICDMQFNVVAVALKS
jgi:hypothetical protein